MKPIEKKKTKRWKIFLFAIIIGIIIFGGIKVFKEKTQIHIFSNRPEFEGYLKTAHSYIKIIPENNLVVNITNERPALNLTKWKESSLYIQFNDTISNPLNANAPTLSNSNGQITYSTPDLEQQFYEIQDSETIPDGGYEYGIKLTQKPNQISLSAINGNSFNFKINTTNLAFKYQLPLNEEQKDSKNCNATMCIVNGTIRRIRPENVVGSYAVYHSSKSNNEYKTGKAFHIYRPEAIDNKGNRTWCDLNITGNNMKITCPMSWLQNAEYPVLIDPTIGYTGDGSSSSGNNANWLEGVNATSTESGTGISIHVRAYDDNFGAHVKGVIVDGNDLSIVTNGVTQNKQLPLTIGWSYMNFTTPPTISAQEYYLAVISNVSIAGAFYISYDSADWDLMDDTTNSFTTPTAPSSGDITTLASRYSIYLTYETTDYDPPLWYNNQTNSTNAGEAILHSVNWSVANSSNTNLSGYVFSWCNETYNKSTPVTFYDNRFTDDFESGLGKWDGNGATPWDLNETQHLSGVNSTHSTTGATDGDLFTDDIDVSNATLINVSFMAYITTPTDAGDLDFYLCHGAGVCTTVDNFGADANNAWVQEIYTTTDSSFFTNDFYVRINSVFGVDEAVYIDDFLVNVTSIGYTYSTENCSDASPTLTNNSWVSFSGISNWSNVTMLSPSNSGATVKWRVFANDTNNIWNVTNIFSYNTTGGSDITSPKYNNSAVNNTSPTILDYVLFSTNWTDNIQLANYTFAWNATGVSCNTWANDSVVSFTGVQNWSNITKQIPATCLLANVPGIGYRIYAMDNSSNQNETGIIMPFITASVNCWSIVNNEIYVPVGCDYYQTAEGYT